MDTTTFAILDDADRILEVLELPDDGKTDLDLSREHGDRYVHLPMGGRVGDAVDVDDDGVATVVRFLP